jgi:phage terminase small subunit
MGLTLKQEEFCWVYVETGNASEAYRRAYPRAEKWKPESVWARASALLKNNRVLIRVEELQKAVADRHEITVDHIIEELDEVRQVSLACVPPQSSSAVSAIMGKAKILGMLTDRVQHTGEIDVKGLSDDQLEAQIAQLAGKAGLAGLNAGTGPKGDS